MKATSFCNSFQQQLHFISGYWPILLCEMADIDYIRHVKGLSCHFNVHGVAQ